MKFNIKVGDTVAIRTHRRDIGERGAIEEKKVTKVGRKLFEVEDIRGQFYLEDGSFKSQWSDFYNAYPSIQEFNNELEKVNLLKSLREAFSGYSDRTLFTLDQLRTASNALNLKQ